MRQDRDGQGGWRAGHRIPNFAVSRLASEAACRFLGPYGAPPVSPIPWRGFRGPIACGDGEGTAGCCRPKLVVVFWYRCFMSIPEKALVMYDLGVFSRNIKHLNSMNNLVPLEDAACHIRERTAAKEELRAVAPAVGVDVHGLGVGRLALRGARAVCRDCSSVGEGL